MTSAARQYEILSPRSSLSPSRINISWVWLGFKENTTAHGVPHVYKARGTVKKVFWTSVLLCSVGMLLLSLSQVLQKYFRFDVDVNARFQPGREVLFPAVTVCNMNPLKKSAVQQTSALQSVLGSKKRKKREAPHIRKKRSYPVQTCNAASTEPTTGVCFTLYHNDLKFDYNTAVAKCNDIGMVLAQMDELAQVTWQKQQGSLQAGTSSKAWIGLKEDSGSYTWTESGNVASHTNWISGEPDTAKPCVFIDSSKEYEWKSKACSDEFLALCSTRLEAATTPSPITSLEMTTTIRPKTQEETTTTIAPTAPADTTTTIAPTTPVETTSTKAPTTQAETTTTIAPTTQAEATTTIAPTTQAVTTTTIAPTAQAETTKTTAPTTQAETTTTTAPTIQAETTTTIALTAPANTTTTIAPTAPADTTTTIAPTTPAETTSTKAPTTKAETTKTIAPTTQAVTTTTIAPTTPAETTTTKAPTAQEETTTTTAPTTPAETTTKTAPTTQAETTTTIAPTSQAVMTTTIAPTTPAETTTTKAPTAQAETTTTTAPTTQAVTTTTTAPTTQIETTTTIEPIPITPAETTTTPAPTTAAETTTMPAPTTAVETTTMPAPIAQAGSTTASAPATQAESTTAPASTMQAENTIKPAPTTRAESTTMPAATTPTPTSPVLRGIPGSRFPERIQTRESFQREERVTEILANLPEKEKASLGFNRAEFILSCKFGDNNCQVDDFATFYNAIHGNCYTFNSGWNSDISLYKTRRVGRKYGLSLILNINQEEYVEDVGDVAGARVVIHDQDKMPFPEEEGLSTAPGYSTSLGIRKSVVRRMPSPHGDCLDPSVPRPDLNVFEEKWPVKYSSMACYKTCYQRHVIQKCGCADSLVPKYGQAFNYTDVSVCNIWNITEDDCRYEVDKLYRENKIVCDCPRSCREKLFQYTVARSMWPSDGYKNDLKKRFSDMAPGVFLDQNDTGKLERNVLSVDVHYIDLTIKNTEESEAYGFENLLSDIGGLLGLLAGFTVMTVFEVVEFVMDLSALLCIREIPTPTDNDIRLKIKQAFMDPCDQHIRRRNHHADYRPPYIKSSSVSRHKQYADLFDLNH